MLNYSKGPSIGSLSKEFCSFNSWNILLEFGPSRLGDLIP